MPDVCIYKLVWIDKTGSALPSRDLMARDDDEALGVARMLMRHGNQAEVRRGDKVVGTVSQFAINKST